MGNKLLPFGGHEDFKLNPSGPVYLISHRSFDEGDLSIPTLSMVIKCKNVVNSSR